MSDFIPPQPPPAPQPSPTIPLPPPDSILPLSPVAARVRVISRQNVIAVVVGLAVALVTFGLFMQTGTLGPALFVVFPIVSGVAMGALMERRLPAFFMVTLTGYLAFVLLSLVVLREGVICMIIATPLFLPLVMIGALFGLGLQNLVISMRGRMSILLALALGNLLYSILWDMGHNLDADPDHTVATTLRINAPPDAVWRALRSDRLYSEPPPLLYQWGLPAPRSLSSNQEGGSVASLQPVAPLEELVPNASWTISNPRGKMTLRAVKVEPASRLSFVFTDVQFYGNPPKGRKPTDWVTMLDGSFVLHDNGNGTTNLTRQVHFRRHLFPGIYFGPVEEFAMDALNGYVLRSVADASEKKH